MKYIITESKINKLVSTYLDERDLDTSDIGNGEFNITDGKHGNDVIRYDAANNKYVVAPIVLDANTTITNINGGLF